MFSVDLLRPAVSVLRGLAQADKETSLDNPTIVGSVIAARYEFFVDLQVWWIAFWI